MRRFGIILLMALPGCAAPAPNAAPTAEPVQELIGRIAGAPQRCVPIERSEGLRIDSGNPATILYGRNKIIWVNRVAGGCAFKYGDTLVAEPVRGSFCRGDLVRSFDPVSKVPGATCIFDDFIPYTR